MATNNSPVVVLINRCDECPHVCESRGFGTSTGTFWGCQHPRRPANHYALSESSAPAEGRQFFWIENIPRGELPEHPPDWCPWRAKEGTGG